MKKTYLLVPFLGLLISGCTVHDNSPYVSFCSRPITISKISLPSTEPHSVKVYTEKTLPKDISQTLDSAEKIHEDRYNSTKFSEIIDQKQTNITPFQNTKTETYSSVEFYHKTFSIERNTERETIRYESVIDYDPTEREFLQTESSLGTLLDPYNNTTYPVSILPKKLDEKHINFSRETKNILEYTEKNPKKDSKHIMISVDVPKNAETVYIVENTQNDLGYSYITELKTCIF